MFDILGRGAKKVAQAVDLIEEDQPEPVEEVPETIGSLIQQQMDEYMVKPKAVGLVQPIIIDPQVILERLTELFGVFKGEIKEESYSCPHCGESGRYKPGEKDLDHFMECENCLFQGDYSDFYDETHTSVETSRRPSDAELMLVTGRPEHLAFIYAHQFRSELKELFGNLHGFEISLPDDSPEHLLIKFRDIKSLAEETQPVEDTSDDDWDGDLYDE